jgi:hypothetical protein
MSPENKEEWVTTWYGWQTLLCDAATLSLWSLAALYHQNNGVRSASVAAGAVVYVWGPPAVHWSHRNSKRAGQSIALRLVLPIAGLLAGIVVGGSSGGGGGDDGLGVALVGFAGLTAGMITASVIDANHAEQPRRPRALSSVQPLFVPASGGGTLMLAGRF